MSNKNDNTRAVDIGSIGLKGLLDIPDDAVGLVIFAHGSGSGRLSPRNNYVARGLQQARLATLLLDLLTPEEEMHRANVFDIPLLASRLGIATAWAREHSALSRMPIGYFGASTGAGAALMAAAHSHDMISAIVSRGGRPDLAGLAIQQVTAPTLLIVGSRDTQVIGLNRQAQHSMHCENHLAIVEGAGHLFEEPGALDEVIALTAQWFNRHLSAAREELIHEQS